MGTTKNRTSNAPEPPSGEMPKILTMKSMGSRCDCVLDDGPHDPVDTCVCETSAPFHWRWAQHGQPLFFLAADFVDLGGAAAAASLSGRPIAAACPARSGFSGCSPTLGGPADTASLDTAVVATTDADADAGAGNPAIVRRMCSIGAGPASTVSTLPLDAWACAAVAASCSVSIVMRMSRSPCNVKGS